jgi:DNA-binding CsgD family transcriptional regulator
VRLSDEKLELARVVCTDRQFAVIALRQRDVGWKLSALVLGVSRSTVREHWEAGMARIEAAEQKAA